MNPEWMDGWNEKMPNNQAGWICDRPLSRP